MSNNKAGKSAQHIPTAYTNISKESPNNTQQNGTPILNYSAVVINSNRSFAGFAVQKNDRRWLIALVF